MKVVSAYNARTSFGELLNEIYYKNQVVLVERKGKPMVKMTRIDKTSLKKNNAFRKSAGAWRDVDVDELIKKIVVSRRDESHKKQLLAR